MSAKITRARCQTARHDISRRTTATRAIPRCWRRAKSSPAAEQPLTYPLYGSLLDLQGVRVDLAGVQAVAVYGKNAEASGQPGNQRPSPSTPDDDSGNLTLKPRRHHHPAQARAACRSTATARSPTGPIRAGSLPLSVLDPSGRAGTLARGARQFHPCARLPAKTRACRSWRLSPRSRSQTSPYPRTRILLALGAAELLRPHGDHGERQRRPGHRKARRSAEILGSGQAAHSQPDLLAEADPAHFCAGATPTGRQSTLAGHRELDWPGRRCRASISRLPSRRYLPL